MHYCYVLSSPETDQLYISQTYDLKRAVNFHNQGKYDETKKYSTWNVLWYGAFTSDELAKEFAEFLKTEIGQKFIKKWFFGETIYHEAERPYNAVVCPICGGKGEAPNRMFHMHGKHYSGNKVICSNCFGNGWVDPQKKVEQLE